MKKLTAIEFDSLKEAPVLWQAAYWVMEEMELDNNCIFTEDYEEWYDMNCTSDPEEERLTPEERAEREMCSKLLKFLQKNKIDCIVSRDF